MIIVCTRCGGHTDAGVVTSIDYRVGSVSQASDAHLCLVCAEALRSWIAEGTRESRRVEVRPRGDAGAQF